MSERRPIRGDDMKWLPWMRGYGRCPYCTGLPLEDWWAICDCGMAGRYETPPPWPQFDDGDLGEVLG